MMVKKNKKFFFKIEWKKMGKNGKLLYFCIRLDEVIPQQY